MRWDLGTWRGILLGLHVFTALACLLMPWRERVWEPFRRDPQFLFTAVGNSNGPQLTALAAMVAALLVQQVGLRLAWTPGNRWAKAGCALGTAAAVAFVALPALFGYGLLLERADQRADLTRPEAALFVVPALGLAQLVLWVCFTVRQRRDQRALSPLPSPAAGAAARQERPGRRG